MSIKIGTKIEKLSPSDTYKLIDWGDVEGSDVIDKSITQLTEGQKILQNNINLKPDGLSMEDEDGNSFDDVSSLAISGATLSNAGGGDINLNIEPKVTVADGQAPGSTSVTGNALVFDGAFIQADAGVKTPAVQTVINFKEITV